MKGKKEGEEGTSCGRVMCKGAQIKASSQSSFTFLLLSLCSFQFSSSSLLFVHLNFFLLFPPSAALQHFSAVVVFFC